MDGSIPHGTEIQVAEAPEPSTVLPQKSGNLAAMGDLMPTGRSDANKQQSVEKCPVVREAGKADQKLSTILTLGSGDESVPEKQVEIIPEPMPRTPLVVPTVVPKVKAARLAQSVAELQVAQLVPTMSEPNGAPFSPGTQPQPETELPSDLLGSPQMAKDSRHGRCLVRRSLVPQSSQAKVTLIHPKKISSAWQTSRKLAQEPVARSCIFYPNCVERILDVKAPRRASSEKEEEVERARETHQEALEGTKGVLHPPNANKIAISTLRAQPESGSKADGSSESKTDHRDKPRVPSKKNGRKRVYKEAIRELNENGDCMDGEVLTPRTRICPPSNIRPEKEQQWLENLRKEKEEELLRKKMKKDKVPHLEEVKHAHLEEMKRNLEEFFQKEWAEQLEIEEKNHPEQYQTQLEKDLAQLEKDPGQVIVDLAELEKDPDQMLLDLAQLEKDQIKLEKDLAQLEMDPDQVLLDLAQLEKDYIQLEKDLAQLEKNQAQLEKALAQMVQNPDQLVQDPTQLERNEEVKDGWQTEKAGKKFAKKLEEAEAWRQMQEAKARRQMQEAEVRMRMQESEVWKWKQEAEAWRQMEEAEVWRRMQEAENWWRMQEAEVWRLKRLQQEKEEGRYQEQLQNKEEEQELLQQREEAPGIWQEQLVLDWFQAEWDQQEKARLLKEQQEKKEKEECQHQEQEK